MIHRDEGTGVGRSASGRRLLWIGCAQARNILSVSGKEVGRGRRCDTAVRRRQGGRQGQSGRLTTLECSARRLRWPLSWITRAEGGSAAVGGEIIRPRDLGSSTLQLPSHPIYTD